MMCDFQEENLPDEVREKIAEMVQVDQVIDLARREAVTQILLGVDHDLLIDGPPVFVYHQ